MIKPFKNGFFIRQTMWNKNEILKRRTNKMYGITITNINYIIDKSKSKKDGVYTARGLSYRVINKNCKYIAYNRKVYQYAYGFLSIIGECGFYKSEEKKALLSIKE